MSGARYYNFREGDRSEYLATFLLSAIGLTVGVPRQEDIGFDYYCTLSDQEKGKLTFGFPFLVQVKSSGSSIFEVKPTDPQKYVHRQGVVPDHIAWLFKHELPLYLAVVNKDKICVDLYSLAPLWFLYYQHENCTECAAIRFVPRVGKEAGPHVDPPVRTGTVTNNPDSYSYDVDVGHPIASFSAKDTEDEEKLKAEKERLRFCIEYEQRNLVFFNASLPHFYWFAETSRDKGLPTPAFYYNEAPDAPDYLKEIYSFLGPALIPLALRYRTDGRADLLDALQTLFREIPSSVIPGSVKAALPEVFPRAAL